MRRWRIRDLLLLGLLALCGAGTAQDDARVGIRQEASAPRAFVQGLLEVRIEAEFDLLWFREFVINTHQATLDLPIEFQVPWWDHGDAREVSESPALPTERRLRVARNGSVAMALVREDHSDPKRARLVCVLKRRIHPSQAGSFELSPSIVRVLATSGFHEDFLSGRVPKDQIEIRVASRPLTVPVDPLPDDSRPRDFGRAIGSFRLEARVLDERLLVNTPFSLEVTVRGEGNFGAFDPPLIRPSRGFHVLGRTDRISDHEATFRFDITPLTKGESVLPPITLPIFDPGPPARFRRLTTGLIRLPKIDGEGASIGDPVLVDELLREAAPGLARRSYEPASEVARDATWILSAPMAILGISALAKIGLRHRQRTAKDRHRRTAIRRFRRRVKTGEAREAFLTYLRERLSLTFQGLAGHAVDERLLREGVSAPLARTIDDLVDRLMIRAYGGSGRDVGTAELMGASEALEAELCAC